jgi:MoaA/NifB/PqqE/SkfB family radical SAM enzyme
MKANLEVVQIQTIDYCNRSCWFCPNKDDVRKTGKRMEWDVFNRILTDLEKMQFGGRISLYLMCEPLIDKRLPDWIAEVRRRFPNNFIMLNSNGDYLNKDWLIKLRDAGLNYIQVNCYDESCEGRNAEFRNIVSGLEGVDAYIHQRKWKDNGNMAVILKRKIPVQRFWNRAGSVKVKCQTSRKVDVCCLPFTQMYINYLGQLVLCCCDYYFEVVMGDVTRDHLWDIWNNEIYKEYRDKLNAGQGKELKLCDKCDRI